MDCVDLTAEQPTKSYGTIDLIAEDNHVSEKQKEDHLSFCWICLRIITETNKLDKQWRELMDTLIHKFTPSVNLVSTADLCVVCYKDFALHYKYLVDFQDRINLVENYSKAYSTKFTTEDEMTCLNNLINSNVLSVNLTFLDQLTDSLDEVTKQIKGRKLSVSDCSKVENVKHEFKTLRAVNDIIEHKIDRMKLGSTTIISRNKRINSIDITECDSNDDCDLGFKIGKCFTVNDDTVNKKANDIERISNAISIDSIAQEFTDDSLLPVETKSMKRDKIDSSSITGRKNESPPLKGFPDEWSKQSTAPKSAELSNRSKKKISKSLQLRKSSNTEDENKSHLPITNKIEGKNVDVVQNVFIMSKPTINNYQKYVKRSNKADDSHDGNSELVSLNSPAKRSKQILPGKRSSKSKRKGGNKEKTKSHDEMEESSVEEPNKPSDVLKTFIDNFVEDELNNSNSYTIENEIPIELEDSSDEELLIL